MNKTMENHSKKLKPKEKMESVRKPQWKIKLDKEWGVIRKGWSELRMPLLVFTALLAIPWLLAIVFNKNANEVISLVSAFVTILTGAVAFTTWVSIQNLRNNQAVELPESGDLSAVVIFNISNSSGIENQIATFCKNDDRLKDITNGNTWIDTDIFKKAESVIEGSGYGISPCHNINRGVIMTHPEIKDDSTIAFKIYKALTGLDLVLLHNSIKDIHLFFRGPTVISFFVGEKLSNCYNVYIYKHLPEKEGEINSVQRSSGLYAFCGKMNHRAYETS